MNPPESEAVLITRLVGYLLAIASGVWMGFILLRACYQLRGIRTPRIVYVIRVFSAGAVGLAHVQSLTLLLVNVLNIGLPWWVLWVIVASCGYALLAHWLLDDGEPRPPRRRRKPVPQVAP